MSMTSSICRPLTRPLTRAIGEAGGGGGGSDPYYANVVSLFNGEGLTNGSTTFPDAKSKTWTAAGDAQIQSEQVEFDGSGDSISTPDATDWNFGAGNFCFEMFITADVVSDNYVMVGKRNGAGYTPFGIGIFSNKLQVLVSQSGDSWASTAADPNNFPTGTQQHVAIERVGTTIYLLRQGSVVASQSIGSGALMTSADSVIIGMWGTSLFPFDGRVRSWRATKGVDRYGGSSYTVPPQYFPTS